ncbi:MAG TPA: TPM domain-containing protein [Gammaproteobacteria bacterium]|nr:TPM domain-containing protein [Gammaproteobacteria bacterium]
MRVLSHLILPRSALARRFPSHALTTIEEAVEASEKLHRAEIRVAIEVALDVRALWRVRSARERAHEVFTELAVWNTRERSGVLIYVLLAERDVEIVADSGFDGRVGESEWQRVCTIIEREFAAGRWRDGVVRGIEAVTGLLTHAFPAVGRNPDEQQNRPAVL